MGDLAWKEHPALAGSQDTVEQEAVHGPIPLLSDATRRLSRKGHIPIRSALLLESLIVRRFARLA